MFAYYKKIFVVAAPAQEPLGIRTENKVPWIDRIKLVNGFTILCIIDSQDFVFFIAVIDYCSDPSAIRDEDGFPNMAKQFLPDPLRGEKLFSFNQYAFTSSCIAEEKEKNSQENQPFGYG
jgi:hypothetical protein